MLAKYNIEYEVPFERPARTLHHLTDDPVSCEEFVSELIERRFKIKSVHHDGLELPQVEFDRMVKTAAGMVTARHLCSVLDIDNVEAHRRFGDSSLIRSLEDPILTEGPQVLEWGQNGGLLMPRQLPWARISRPGI